MPHDATLGAVRSSWAFRLTLLPALTGQAMMVAVLGPVVPALAIYFGGGPQGALAAQLVAISPFAGLMAGGLGSGWGIRAVGLKSFASGGALLYALAGLAGLFVSRLSLLLAAGCVLGLGAVFLLTGLSGLTAIAYHEDERGKLLGLQSAIASLFNITFGLAAGILSETLGWRVPFGFFLVFGAVMTMLCTAAIPPVARKAVSEVVAPAHTAWASWSVWLAGAAAFMIVMAEVTQLPFLLEAGGLTSAGTRAVILTGITIAATLASFGYGLMRSRIGDRGLIVITGITGVAGWILLGFWSGGTPAAFLGASLLGIGGGILVPLLYAAVMRLAPGESSGQAIGLLNVAICIGCILNPLLSKAPSETFGLKGFMFVLALLTAIVMTVALMWPARPTAR